MTQDGYDWPAGWQDERWPVDPKRITAQDVQDAWLERLMRKEAERAFVNWAVYGISPPEGLEKWWPR